MSFTLKPYVNTGQTVQPKFPYAPLHWGLKGDGGGAPIIPGGYVIRLVSYSVSRMGLVTGDNLSSWQSEPPPSDSLTQATSFNQPTLFEYDVVKQSILANMPTLVDTGSGVLAMKFGVRGVSSASMTDLPLQTGDFTYYFKGLTFDDVTGNSILLHSGTYLQIASSGQVNLRSNEAVSHVLFTSYPIIAGQKFDLNVVREGNNVRGYIDGVISPVGNIDCTGNTFSFESLSRNSTSNSIFGSLERFQIYDSAVNDPENTIEIPVRDLVADSEYMRNDSNATPSIGDSISAWLSTTHEPYENEVRFTGNNKFMGDLPTQAGDFSYIFKGSVDVQAQDKRVFSNSGTGRSIGYDSSEVSYVEADDGTRYTFPEITNVGDEKVFIIVREGNTLRAYNGYTPTATTHDVTGKTFTYDRIGSNTLSINGYKKEDTVYDYAVTDEQAKWWSYLRSASGNILTPPLLPSATYAVNSANLNGTNQYFTYNQPLRNSVMGFSVWVNSDSIGAVQRIIAESSAGGNIEVGVQIVVGKVRFLWRNNATIVQQLDSVTTLLSDTWYHIVCTFDTSQGMKIYINGVLDSSNSKTGTISATTITGSHVGTYQDLLNFFNGDIAMLGVYHRYLSQADVDALYNNGTPLCYADIDTSITANGVYAPRLVNWNTNAGQELVDQSGSGVTTTNVNSVPFTGTGLNVECD